MTTHPVEGRFVVLHIGLPKTGTTFLLDRVFSRAKALTLVHRRLRPDWAGLSLDLRRYGRMPGFVAPYFRHRAAVGLRAVAPRDPGTLLLSDDNLAIDAHALWRGRGPSPEGLAARLATLAESVTPLGQLRVLISVRRQDRWLAARYADSARHYPDFDQVDFDRRMARLVAAETLSGPWGWADYAAVERVFATALGAENVMLLSLERVAAAPARSMNQLGRFLGVRVPRGPAKGARIARALGEEAWPMRGGGDLILKPDVRDMILERFGPSNAELAARAELGF